MFRTISVFAFCAALVLAADRPNLSGEWKLDVSKSDFGAMPAPEKMTRKIEHAESNFHIVTTQSSPRGERTTDVKYTLDGKPNKVQVMGRDATVKAKWDGAVLVVETELDFDGNKILQKERIKVSDDGKSMSSESTLNSPMGENTSKLVFTKGS